MRGTVLLADDHALMRYGLRALLESAGYEIVAEASEGREALRLALALAPDIVIMDLTMPELNGIEATRSIKARLPDARIIILSMHGDAEYVHRALAAGASAYLVKRAHGDEVLAAVRAVQLGRQFLSSALDSNALREDLVSSTPIERLSSREQQVLQLVVEGHSSAAIARRVHLSPKSIDTYRSRVMKKLGVPNVTALIKFALAHGLTPSN